VWLCVVWAWLNVVCVVECGVWLNVVWLCVVWWWLNVVVVECGLGECVCVVVCPGCG